MNFNLCSIGKIRTPYIENAPYQPIDNDKGEFYIELNAEYSEGILGLEDFTYIFVIYLADRVNRELQMKVRPPWVDNVNVGIFASRSPVRPNPIGLSVVRIKKLNGNRIYTSGLDVFDETPLLDIKPYIDELDNKKDANKGWIDNLENQEHLSLHIKGIPHDY